MAVKAKKAATPSKKAPAKAEKKGSVKASAKAAPSPELTAAPVAAEDAEDAEEDAAVAASSSAGGGNAAAIAAASSGTEMSASFKNFRHHPDMENFYRFIYENDLRHEALAIIDEIMVQKQNRKLLKGAKASPH